MKAPTFGIAALMNQLAQLEASAMKLETDEIDSVVVSGLGEMQDSAKQSKTDSHLDYFCAPTEMCT